MMWRIFDALDDIGIAKVGQDANILKCNAAFANIFGDDPIHLCGKNVIDITAPLHKEKEINNINQLFNKNVTNIKHIKQYQKSDGTCVEKKIHTFAIYDDKENVSYLLSFVYSPIKEKTNESKRIHELETMLCKVLSLLDKEPNIEVIMNNQTQTVNADNNSNASINTSTSNGLSSKHIVIIAAILSILSLGIIGRTIYLNLNPEKPEIQIKNTNK